MLPRTPLLLILIVLAAVAGLVLVYSGGRPAPPTAAGRSEPAPSPSPRSARQDPAPPPPIPAREDCSAPRWAAAANANAQSLVSRVWSPMRRIEVGWAAYAPLIAREIGTACPPATGGFAEALARWQVARRQPPTGTLDPDSFEVMRLI